MSLKNQKIISFFLFFSYLCLPGCATFLPNELKTSAEQHLTWNQRQAQLRKIQQWDLNGSLGVNYQGRSDIVNFVWEQKNTDYTINFHGPLHLGGANLIGNSSKVSLLKGTNDVVVASSPEELLLSQFGWSLPISDMTYWIKAMPSPNSAINNSSLDYANHLIFLEQRGWQIHYAAFKTIDGIDLPTKIYLQSASVGVKIVCKWSLS